MASIEKRPTKRGKVHWRVRWRTGGGRDGEWDGETFKDDNQAIRFRALVDLSGQEYPPPEMLKAHGFEFLIPAGSPVRHERYAQEGVSEPVLIEPYARKYVSKLRKASQESKRKYIERLERHVFPVLGQRPASDVTRGEMGEWQDGLRKSDGSLLRPKTIANIRGEVLYPMFDAMCRTGDYGEPPIRFDNPLHGLDLPNGAPFVREILESEENARIFLECAYEIDPEAGDLLTTKLGGGFRWGEVAAIPCRAVLIPKGTVAVRQVLFREGNQWFLRPYPKTPEGFREIPLPEPVMNMLAIRCENLRPTDFVFRAPEGNFWRYSQFYDGRWAKIRELYEAKTGVRLQMYSLRHSILTLLGSSNIDLNTLRVVAGHKKVSTTFNFYIHPTTRHFAHVRAVTSSFVAGRETAGGQTEAS
jgi:integrase